MTGEQLNELALFAGAGGGILGGHLLGWRCVCAVEIEDYPRRVLLARQRDGMLPCFPIWDDVTTFDGHAWRGRVDVISGGFPCQDISAAGKGAGITGARSGLWSHMARIIGEVRPRYVLVENSPLLVSRGLDVVLSDLAALGYDARWGVIGAHHAGAPHKRDRIWILADAEKMRRSGGKIHQRNKLSSFLPEETSISRAMRKGCTNVADAASSGCLRAEESRLHPAQNRNRRANNIADGNFDSEDISGNARRFSYDWWQFEPDVGRVAHGVAARVDRLKAIGNGQVPAVVRLAWETLTS